LQTLVDELLTKNEGLEKPLEITHTQLVDEATMFQTFILCRMDAKSQKISTLENIMESIFHNLCG